MFALLPFISNVGNIIAYYAIKSKIRMLSILLMHWINACLGLPALYPFVLCEIWPGAGRDFGGDNTEGQGDAPQAAYSPYPPRFSPPSPRFPDPLTPLGRTACLCLYGCFQPCVSFGLRAVNGGISRKVRTNSRCSFGGLQHREQEIPQKPRLAACRKEYWESFLHCPRRKTPAQAPRPGGGSPLRISIRCEGITILQSK